MLLTPLIDGDILRYEVGFGAEVSWEGETPPDYHVRDFLYERIEEIIEGTGGDMYTSPLIFLTEHPVFREEVAITRPYKGHRQSNKPKCFDYITELLNTEFMAVTAHRGLEADDMMSIYHEEDTIICSRDKDLRQVPGWYYSWELGKAPSFGPYYIENPGWLTLNKGKLFGVGDIWFWAQMIMGDTADNIPGLPKYGAVKAYAMLEDVKPESFEDVVYKEYEQCYGLLAEDVFEEHKLLLRMIRSMEEWKTITDRLSLSASKPTPPSIADREKVSEDSPPE